ncbi:MAG: SUF system NifU family Fe-S cluster assembly protein [Alphaproteobacteria bacterium]
MSDLRDLYQEMILDHNRHPRNFGELPEPARRANGHNPLCGDRLTVYVVIEGGKVKDVHFKGNGCAISMASASIMTELVKGRSTDEVRVLFDRFHRLVTSEGGTESLPEDDEALAVFAGVREFPVRVKCATLPWHTLKAALDSSGATVATE